MVAAKPSAAKAPARKAAPRKEAGKRAREDVAEGTPTQPPALQWLPAAAPVAWAPPPPPAPTLPTVRPVRGLASALVALIVVDLLFTSLSTFLAFQDLSTKTIFLVGTLGFLVAVPTIIVFCMWLHRVLSNARDAAPQAGIRPGWAVGSFFIPFVQLLAPYFQVRRAWDADTGRPGTWVAVWFFAWSLSLVVSLTVAMASGVSVAVDVFSIDAEPGSDEHDEAQDEVQREARERQRPYLIPSTLLHALAGVALILLARDWSAFQESPPAS